MTHSVRSSILKRTVRAGFDKAALTRDRKGKVLRALIAHDEAIETAVMLASVESKGLGARWTQGHFRFVHPFDDLLFIFFEAESNVMS